MANIDLRPLFYTLMFFLPFGIWKLIDIFIWIISNVTFGLK